MGRRTTSEQIPLKELERQFLADDAQPASAHLLGKLRRDPRAGARRLYRRLKGRLDRDKKEEDRLEAMLHFESLLWKAGIRRIAGVDEVGVGPMAGPVVAAAVVLRPGARIEGVDDSKKLDSETRESLDLQIRQNALEVSIGAVESPEIDRLNIYHAGIRAMWLAVTGLAEAPQHILVDSRTIPNLTGPQNSFNKGDGINFSIACASIVAKVYRDRLMTDLDRTYPGYGFRKHKGYCTPAHQEAIRQLGPCPIHRRSFDFIRELRGEYGEPFYDLKKKVHRAQLSDWETDFSTAIIRELRGEYGEPFYDLKKKVQEAASRQQLSDWETDFQAARRQLSPVESKKLRLLATRRWKRVDG